MNIYQSYVSGAVNRELSRPFRRFKPPLSVRKGELPVNGPAGSAFLIPVEPVC